MFDEDNETYESEGAVRAALIARGIDPDEWDDDAPYLLDSDGQWRIDTTVIKKG
jgi:hypothetical protein